MRPSGRCRTYMLTCVCRYRQSIRAIKWTNEWPFVEMCKLEVFLNQLGLPSEIVCQVRWHVNVDALCMPRMVGFKNRSLWNMQTSAYLRGYLSVMDKVEMAEQRYRRSRVETIAASSCSYVLKLCSKWTPRSLAKTARSRTRYAIWCIKKISKKYVATSLTSRQIHIRLSCRDIANAVGV